MRLRAKNWDQPVNVEIAGEVLRVLIGCANRCPIIPNTLFAGTSEDTQLCFQCWVNAGKPYRERKEQANGVSQ